MSLKALLEDLGFSKVVKIKMVNLNGFEEVNKDKGDYDKGSE